jgi:WD40 repeat protein
MTLPLLFLAAQVAAQPAQLVIQTGHSLPVVSVALSHDGNLLATGSRDGTSILWETSTGHKLREIKAEPLGVSAVALSPDGRRLLTGGAGTAKLWDTENGTLLRKFGVPGEFLRSVLFSPDGKSALTAGDDGAAKLWDLATGRRLRLFGDAPARLAAAAFSRDGRRLATAAEGADIWIWDVETGALSQQLVGGGPWSALAFSPDGRSVVAGSANSLSVWDVETGKTRLTFKSSSGRAVAALPGGRLLISCGGSNTARLWDATSGDSVRALIGHLDAVGAMAVSDDGRFVVTGSDDHTARRWDAATGRSERVFGGAALPVLFAAVSNDGRRLALVDPQKASLWDLDQGVPVSRSTGDWQTYSHFTPSRDGRYLASIKEQDSVDLRDLQDGKDLGSSNWGRLKAHALALDPAARFLVSAFEDDLQASALPDGSEHPMLGGHKERAGWLAVGFEGRRLVTRGGDGAVAIWDLDSGRRVARFKLETSSLPDLLLSRDGRYLAAGAAARSGRSRYALSIRNLDDGEEMKTWETDQTISMLSFGPAGDTLLVLSEGGAWEWDLLTGRKQNAFSPPEQDALDWPEAVDPAWKYVLARREEGLSIVSMSTGKELGLLRLSDKGWLLSASDGRLDASPEAVRWTVGLRSYPLREFAGPALTPGLLGRLLRGPESH